MCGIAGAAWTAESPPLERDVLQRMVAALAHRGPDAEGLYLSGEASPAAGGAWTGPGAALGHRRLSIIDLSDGQQPLSNEDGTVWIAFNGEIYNYRELQPQLAAQGHRFRTASDTEVIVHLYEQYGPACVDHLRGMFAFAIWDQNRRRLFLARDRLGKKPLVYRHEANRLLFASELKAILQVPSVPRELDLAALDEYLCYQYVPHPHCIFRGFAKLPPAHWAIYQDGKLQIERYWKPDYEPHLKAAGPPPARTPDELRRELRATLTEAVRLRLRSDVPLGSFLSGGIDSTIISGLMQELSEQPINTFSIGFPVKEFDERHHAREAARHLGTRHHEQLVEPSALAILPKLIWHYDEPFADSSAIPTLYLSQMTREHVTVALSGDGGDELFGGYQRYQAARIGSWVDRLPRFVRNWLGSPLWQRIPATAAQRRRRRLKRLLNAIGQSPERRYLSWICIFDDQQRHDLYSNALREQLANADAGRFLLRAYEECPSRDFVTQTTCADLLTYLPCDILTKVDIASMAYGLECRAPFLDQQVADFAARLPISLKLHGRQGKQILLDTFADLIPPGLRHRPKQGFGVPLSHWFRGELRPLLEDVLLDPAALGRGLFRPEAVRQLVTQHVQGHHDHSHRLWALLVLELWQQTFLDPAVPPTGPALAVSNDSRPL